MVESFQLINFDNCWDVLQDIVLLVVGRLASGHRMYKDAYALRLMHPHSRDFYWLRGDLTICQVRQKYSSLLPDVEWRQGTWNEFCVALTVWSANSIESYTFKCLCYIWCVILVIVGTEFVFNSNSVKTAIAWQVNEYIAPFE